LLVPSVWLGHELVVALLHEADAITVWAIGGAFGCGIVVCLGFVLGESGLLRPQAIWPILLVIVVVLVLTARRRMLADVSAFYAWLRRPITRDPLPLLLAGAGIAVYWINLIGALAPEITSDAVRQRLATAARFAAAGQLTANNSALVVARDPAAGEIAYATALAIGPLQSAKLFHFIVGLGCAAAIFALGRRLGGARAGALASFAFYTMPLVGSLSQSAYLDLIPTLCGVAAALIILSRERPDWHAALAAGICLGIGVAVKIQFGYVAVGIAVILSIVSLRRGGVLATARLVAILSMTAVIVAGPFLVRSYVLTGNIPGLAIGTQSLTRTAGQEPATLGILNVFGYGRSLGDLIRAPFDLTVRSGAFTGDTTRRYWGPFGGHLGFLLFGLAPLLALARLRSRRLMLALLAGAAIAFLLWFYTVQYLRYGLPIFALLCPVAGVAYALTHARIQDNAGRTISNGLLLLLAAATVATGVSVPNVEWHYTLGRENATSYLTQYLACCGGYTALRLLDTEPGATHALAIPEQAQLYTRVPLSSPGDGALAPALSGTDEQVLAWLDASGYSHIIIDRRLLALLRPDWDQATAIDEDFLRRNAVLVGGDHNAYLYRLLPPDQRGGQLPWAQGEELLPNGGFETTPSGAPLGWTPTGQPRYDSSGSMSNDGKEAVLLTPQDALATSVNVIPNRQYLLSHATWSAAGPGEARLYLEWHDSAGHIIGIADETVPVSQRGYHTFSMLATAPAGATTVTVRLAATQGDVWFDDVSLRAR
jgi:4-amino-4-deoxy-L-arabinose transferase-like glycosyltransferase